MSDLLWPRSFSFVSACSVEQRQLWDSSFSECCCCYGKWFPCCRQKNAYVFLLVIFISRRAPLKITFLWSGLPVEYLSQRLVSATITGIEPRSVLVIIVTSQRTRLLKSCFHMIITIIELLLNCWSHMETSLTWLLCRFSAVGRFCPTRSTVVRKYFVFYVFAVFKHLHCTAVLNPTVGELRLAAYSTSQPIIN